MKTIQEYFDTNFTKFDKLIKVDKISEPLIGHILTLENYPDLESLDIQELEQVQEIILKDCPKLKTIKYSNKEQKPVIIQPPKNCDWRCFAIAGLLLWNAVIFYLMIRWVKNHKKKCETCKN